MQRLNILQLAQHLAGSGREADAKGEGIHDCVSGFLGAGSVLAGDDLARPDGEAVPVTHAANVDAAHLQQGLHQCDALIRHPLTVMFTEVAVTCKAGG